MTKTTTTRISTLFAASLISLLNLSCNAGSSASSESLSFVRNAGAAEAPAAAPAQAPAADQELRLALKFVNYTKNGKPILDRPAMDKLTAEMNTLMAPCKISYVVEETIDVNPLEQGLTYGLSDLGQLHDIRTKFDDPSKLVIINTGAWDHDSTGSANAWTMMPGETPSGAVLESSVANFAGIVAHELGHYLSLDHVSDDTNLMNPIIYDYSTAVDAGQCRDMRDAAVKYRAQALR